MDKLQIRLLALIALALAGPVGCGDDDSVDHDHADDGGGPKKDGGGSAGKGGTGAAGSGHAGTSGGKDSGVKDASTADGGGVDSGMDGGTTDGGPPPSGCPVIGDREVVEVPEEISEDTVWTCDNLYVLKHLTFIVDDKTLTVEAGTVVQGDLTSALIATRGSQLITEGTATDPVVFTSSADEGLRVPGDWGGVVLLGAAPINVPSGENRIEGIDPVDPRGQYGGDDETHNCGNLEYTRIEFAGFQLSLDNELNGLTMGGCGSDTKVSFVQVHKGNDDGIEIFGGGPKLDHIVLTANEDDQFDTDLGYVGTVQFMVIQQDADSVNSTDPQGFEWDNNPDNFDATPRNAPVVYNATLIGAEGGHDKQTGAILRRGTHGILRNLIITGFPNGGIDVRDMATVAATAEDPPTLTVENSLFFGLGSTGTLWSPVEPTDGTSGDNDMGFVESDFLTGADRHNVFDMDPELGDPHNLTDPNFVPASGSPAADGAATPPAGFDTSATYMGAFEPGGDDWTEGWTAYPQD